MSTSAVLVANGEKPVSNYAKQLIGQNNLRICVDSNLSFFKDSSFETIFRLSIGWNNDCDSLYEKDLICFEVCLDNVIKVSSELMYNLKIILLNK